MPVGVERLGIALEPEEPYEINILSGGGVEDPRITFVPALDRYVMAYVAYGPQGPRVALAISADLFSWTRLGLVDFAPEQGVDFNGYPNKDAFFFPEPVLSPRGELQFCLMHRPIYEHWEASAGVEPQQVRLPDGVSDRRPSIWLSYCRSTICRLTLAGPRLCASPNIAWWPFLKNHGKITVLARVARLCSPQAAG